MRFLVGLVLVLALWALAQVPAQVPAAVGDEEALAEGEDYTEAEGRAAALAPMDVQEAEELVGVTTSQEGEQINYEDAQGRWVLSWGPAYADDHSWFEYYPLATTFTAPFDCRLVAYRILWSGYAAMYAAEGQAPAPLLDVMLYADDGTNRPTGEPLFTKQENLSGATAEWIEVDVSDWGVELREGEVFHPGWSSNTELASALSYQLVSGSYSCWYTLNSADQPTWMDAQNDWTHVVEAVVEGI